MKAFSKAIFTIGTLGAVISVQFVVPGIASAQDDIDYTNAEMPVYKDQCKNGGWIYYIDDQGQPFKNQGQCVSFTVPVKKLPPISD